MTWLRLQMLGFLWIWRLDEGPSEPWGQGTFQGLLRSGRIRYVQIDLWVWREFVTSP